LRVAVVATGVTALALPEFQARPMPLGTALTIVGIFGGAILLMGGMGLLVSVYGSRGTDPSLAGTRLALAGGAIREAASVWAERQVRAGAPVPSPADREALAQAVAAYGAVGGNVVLVEPVPSGEAHKYGIVALGGCCIVTMHPQVIGRPHRLAFLDRFISEVRARDDVWIATCAEIAAHAR